MEGFQIEIAGMVVRVNSMFQSTKEYCKVYLSDKEPDFILHVTPEDLLLEQILLEKEAVEEGLKIRKFKAPFLERSVIQHKIADRLVYENTIMMHGSTVSLDGQAYLFTAPCGTGKSTHTRLWREMFGERAVMVNDDKPFLKITSSGVLAFGSPWNGKHGLSSNVCVPLKGICLLHRGKENIIRHLDAQCGISSLFHQVHIPKDPALAEKTAALFDSLVKSVPLWEMYCNIEPDAARISFLAMSGNE